MTIIRSLATAALLAGLALAARAHDYKAGDIAIDHPWARATATGQPAGGAYLTLENRGGAADRLVGARADVAKSVELHHMQMQGDVMRMRQVEGIDVPAGGQVELKPGGLHLMLMGLKAPLKEGDRFPMTLQFQKAGEVKVDVRVDAVKVDAKAAEHKH